MGTSAIQAAGLSKRYHIAAKQADYSTLRQALVEMAGAPLRRARRVWRGEHYGAAELTETLWALKGISFEIEHGEATGIIGHNGAGKSTLLKILARITEPTTGYVDVYGRVAALLEVGTGFHSELTGRENIYLNAAILGMRRAEIKRKFDEMVAFSGVEPFVDTPVKYYSSGMRLRLGFAVAAYLQAEILLVDEVLAGGDVAFQKKCLGKMSEITREGRTVLLVSHNLAAISKLCRKTFWLAQGHLVDFGETHAIIRAYLAKSSTVRGVKLAERQDRQGNESLRFESVVLRNSDGAETELVQAGSPVTFELHYRAQTSEAMRDTVVVIRVYDQFKQLLFTLASNFTQEIGQFAPTGTVFCDVPQLLLSVGTYQTEVLLFNNRQLADAVDDASRFTVVESDFYGSHEPMHPSTYGPLLMPQRWYSDQSQNGRPA